MPLEYDLQVKFRGSNTVYKTTGQCQHKKNGIECETSDGHAPSLGIFVVTKDNYILFYVKELIGVWQDGVEENEYTVRPFEAGKDDDVFRMNKSACWK
jgi:hypothetical protein